MIRLQNILQQQVVSHARRSARFLSNSCISLYCTAIGHPSLGNNFYDYYIEMLPNNRRPLYEVSKCDLLLSAGTIFQCPIMKRIILAQKKIAGEQFKILCRSGVAGSLHITSLFFSHKKPPTSYH